MPKARPGSITIASRRGSRGSIQGGTIRKRRPTRIGLNRFIQSVDHPGSVTRVARGRHRRGRCASRASIPAEAIARPIAARSKRVRRLKYASSVTVLRGESGRACSRTAHPRAPRATSRPAASSAIAAGVWKTALTKLSACFDLGRPFRSSLPHLADGGRVEADAASTFETFSTEGSICESSSFAPRLR